MLATKRIGSGEKEKSKPKEFRIVKRKSEIFGGFPDCPYRSQRTIELCRVRVYICQQARKKLKLYKPATERKLPQLLSEADLKRFFSVIQQVGDLQHKIMLKLLFYTAVRVSELINIRVEDVDTNSARYSSTRVRVVRTGISCSRPASALSSAAISRRTPIIAISSSLNVVCRILHGAYNKSSRNTVTRRVSPSLCIPISSDTRC